MLLLCPGLWPGSPMGDRRKWFCSGVQVVQGASSRRCMQHIFGKGLGKQEKFTPSKIFSSAPRGFVHTVVGTVRPQQRAPCVYIS